jgi:hypothetical protein
MAKRKINTDFRSIPILIDTVDMPDWALPYLINGDASALDDDDEKLVDRWVKDHLSRFPHGASILVQYDPQEDPSFTWAPEIGAACNCYTTDVYINTDRIYLDETQHRSTDTPRSGMTATGYGRKLPTQYMITINDREYRVYATGYSNASTLWIQTRHGRVIVQ